VIFVTVGTHEQPFNRLIETVDTLAGNRDIDEMVYMQIGYSTYIPKHCKWVRFLGFDAMNKYMRMANLVICHGGPATFMKALSFGKRVIIAPRLKKFGEHVNNHQATFLQEIKRNGYQLETIVDMKDLAELLKDEYIEKTKFVSHNREFVKRLKKEIYSL